MTPRPSTRPQRRSLHLDQIRDDRLLKSRASRRCSGHECGHEIQGAANLVNGSGQSAVEGPSWHDRRVQIAGRRCVRVVMRLDGEGSAGRCSLSGFPPRRDDGGLGAQFRRPRLIRMDQQAWNGLKPRELGGRKPLPSREQIEPRTAASLGHEQRLKNTDLADGRGKSVEVNRPGPAVTASISSIEICRTVWSGVSPINCST